MNVMLLQARKMSVVEEGKYLLLFTTDADATIQIQCSVRDDGGKLQVIFDEAGANPALLQTLTTSTAWEQALRSFHTVSATSYTVTGKQAPPWGNIPIQLREIEREADDACRLQFMEPDKATKSIHVKLTMMSLGEKSFSGYDIDGDKTAISRIYDRDILQVTRDFLNAAQTL